MASHAQKTGSWNVLSPGGIYFQDLQQAFPLLNGKMITDFTLTPEGNLWVVAGNNVYHVKINEKGSGFDFDAIPSGVNTGFAYGKSKIPPKIVSGYPHSVAVVTDMSVLSTNNDGQDWELISTLPGPDDIESYDFDELTDASSSPLGTVLSGKKKNTPGLCWYDKEMGRVEMYLSAEIAETFDIKKTFSYYDLNEDKDGIIWALGGPDKKYLWKLYRGSINPVDFPHPILDITTDHTGRLIVATPTSIVAFDKDGNITPVLETGASFVAFDNDGIIWYVPANEMKIESENSMKLSGMIKSARAGMKQPVAENEQAAASPALLVRYNPATKQAHELTAENSMIKGQIHKMLFDNDNNKYILAGDMLKEIYIFTEPRYTGVWTDINPIFDGWEALNRNYWEAGCFKSDGSFHAIDRLVDGNYQISVFSGGKWSQQPYELGEAKLFFTISDAAIAGETMYAATNNLLYSLKDGKMAQVSGMDKKALSNRILALTVDHSNRLWIGSADGLASYDGAAFTYFGKKYTPGPASVKTLSLCSSGDAVFVGTSDGLSVYSQNNWTSFDKKTGLDNNRVNALAADSKGRVFVGTVTAFGVSDVLTVYEDGKLTNEKIPQKIYVKKMLVDANDNLWIAGENDFVCRKANGEYVFYPVEDTPLYRGYVIRNMSIVNNRLYLSVSRDPKGYHPTTSSTSITASLPEFGTRILKGLNAFDPDVQVFVMKIE
jgi:hypothetical protein